MAGAGYDTLTIKINADSSEAKSSIKSLSSSLDNLNKKAKELDTARLTEIKGLLQGIAKIDFSNVSKGLQDVVSAFKSLSKASVNKTPKTTPTLQVPPMGTETGTNIFDQYKAIKDISVSVETPSFESFVAQVAEANKGLAGIQTHFEGIKQSTVEITDVFAEFNLTTSEAKTVVSALSQEVSNLDDKKIEELGKTLKTLGYSTEQVSKAMKDLRKEIDGANGSAEKASTNGFKKLINQFNKIVKYRIIRKIIQEIYKALTEGIKNVIAFDDKTSKAVDNIASKFEFLKNSIGAMIAPLIQVVEPLLTGLLQVSGELGNSFAELFAGVNGQTTFAKARDDLEGFNKEAKKTQTLGIDELNIISGGNDYFTQEDVKLGSELSELASTLKDLFATIKDLFGNLMARAKKFTENILPKIAKLLKPIVSIIDKVLELVDRLINNTESGVATSLIKFTEMLSEIFNIINSIIDDLMPVLKPIIDAISVVINVINSALGDVFYLVSMIVEMLQPILTLLKPILEVVGMIASVINGVVGGALTTIVSGLEGVIDFFKTAVDTLVAIFNGDFDIIGDLWQQLGVRMKSIWVGVGNFFIRVLNTITEGFENFLNWFVKGVGNIAEAIGIDTSSWGVKFNKLKELEVDTNGNISIVNSSITTPTSPRTGKQDPIEKAEDIGLGDYLGIEREIVINLDGYEIARAVTKNQKNSGDAVQFGGNIKYGV